MIGFEPTEEQGLIVGSVTAFARDRLRPTARVAEAARAYPDAVLEEAQALGLTTLELSPEAGGPGFGLLDMVLIEEALAWGDPAASLAFGGAHALGCVVRELCPGERATRWLGSFAQDGARRFGALAWSEPRPAEHPGMSTTATREGDVWVLRGAKSYVHNAGRAELYAVAAQVDPARGWEGLGVFMVPGDAPGLGVTPRRRALGLDAVTFAGVTLTEVRVPVNAHLDPGTQPGALFRGFLRVALRNAARCVGLARAAFELALAYTQERVAFGKPVAHFQAVAFNLADRHMDVEAATLMVRRAASAWDLGRPRAGDVAAAGAMALRAAMRCADDAVQLHGGAGFMRDYLPEKLMRDAKTLGLYGMTAATLDQITAATELGARESANGDAGDGDAGLPGAVALPTSDAQPVFT